MTRHTKSWMVEQNILTDVTCDRCGNSCVRDRFVPMETHVGYLGPEVEVLLTEKGTFSASWGFHSNHDDTRWSADLCETCCEALKEWIEAAGGKMRVRESR